MEPALLVAICAAIVAAYAAIVATLNLAWTIYVGWRDAVHVRLEVSWVQMVPGEQFAMLGRRTGPILGLNVVNHGRRPVTINEVGIIRSTREQKLAVPKPLHGELPFTLTEGTGRLLLLVERPQQPFSSEFTDGVRLDKAYALDATGRYHTVKLPRSIRDELFGKRSG